MVGIGGMGMAPIAIYLRQAGFAVSGCDDNLRPAVAEMLLAQGIDAAKVSDPPKGVDRVLYSSAVKEDHPCLQQAVRQGIPALKRGEMLAETLSGKKLVAIVGSHGKSTVAGMLISALRHNRFEFGYVLGALFCGENSPPAQYSVVPWVIAEIDESDGTIEKFSPEITVVVNLDWDHPDFYEDAAAMEEVFARLFKRTSQAIFIPSGNDTLAALAKSGTAGQVITFGVNGDYEGNLVENSAQDMTLNLGGRFPRGKYRVRSTGAFNAGNALCALATAHHLDNAVALDCLSAFPGIKRRQTLLYESESAGLVVYEDYAHHPAEISALLKFAREQYAEKKLVVVFQPHRYSRTRQFKSEIAGALSEADAIFLLEVYPAGESPLKGGTSDDLLNELASDPSAKLVHSDADLNGCLKTVLEEPTALFFVGAGDIDGWAADFTANIGKSEEAAVNCVNSKGGLPRWWSELKDSVNSDTLMVTDESLAEKTTLGVGGNARFYAEPACLEDLQLLLNRAGKAETPFFILGRGSNLLVPDEGFEGLVIRLVKDYWRQIRPLGKGRIWVGAGARLKRLCGEACRLGLSGFEFLEGIPGSLGGALRMNAGAMGGWIFETVEEVHLVTSDGEIKKLPPEAFQVGYRECRGLEDCVAFGAILNSPAPAASEDIRRKIADFAKKRKSSQPRESNAGCIFKNPVGSAAGGLIDELGLKGRQVGNAQVSTVHGNFIINRGGATSGDIITLITQIRSEVKKRRGVELQPEVIILGKNWDNMLS